MPNKSTRPECAAEETCQPEQPLLELGDLREKHGIPRPVFAGVCAVNGWRAGRVMTEEAFLRAVADFTGASMGAPWRK